MSKKILSLFISFFCLGSLTAQNFIGSVNPYPAASMKIAGGDTLKILAVMVDFQEDKDAGTIGNGKFGSMYSKNYGDTIIDPLPHDQAYFKAHLQFVKNYFEKVSKGKLHIKYFVLPNIITVSQTMRNYSPDNKSNDFTPLANLSKEVWEKADSANPGFDFSSYSAFTIFHAGVGRDVSLPVDLGIERDIPSVYLSTKALKKTYGENFKGFSVSNGTFNITNSLIMPETESREVISFGTTVLYQITINGLLAANIASHLGLPDLFDTKTGLSAIGRFGLMDGQSIFAYNGAFPPEPSAWEKIFLNWAEPVTIEPGSYTVNVLTNLAASINDTTILKVPISSTEYFLIENRQRDANKDGAKITYRIGNSDITKTFLKDESGFFYFDISSIKGVVTDVDEFDWSLPGLINDTSNYNGGILIWHIDENIINEKIGDDQINADKNNRGVRLVEADGINDIGEKFQTILGETVIGEGSWEDYWYASNKAVLYKNKFSKDTRPNSNSNSGANSLITISNFSNSANRMSFNVNYGDSIISPLFNKKLPLSSNNYKITSLSNNSGFGLIADGSLYLINQAGIIQKTIPNFSKYKIASVSNNNINYIAGAYGTRLNVLITDAASEFETGLDIGDTVTAAPVIRQTSNGSYQILLGTSKGKVNAYSLGNLPSTKPELIQSYDLKNVLPIKMIAADGDYFAVITSMGPQLNSKGASLLIDNSGKAYTFNGKELLNFALTKDRNGDLTAVVLDSENDFSIITNGNLIKEFKPYNNKPVSAFALADIKQDGSNYILFVGGNKIQAVNLNGNSADNFPFEDYRGYDFTGSPLAADFEGDNKSEVIAATTDGRIFAVDGGTGKTVSGFPITIGSQLITVPALFNSGGKISIAALNSQNYLSAWNIGPTVGKTFWSEENGNSLNTAFLTSADGRNFISDFLPSDKAYNYPNPVYGEETNIHYYVSEDSKIDIKIFDLAGDLVAQLNDNARGGMDNETVWNVSNIQSGVYLARVEAVGSSGKSDNKIIKIAVIK